MTKSLDDFREDLGQIESSGRYNVENPFGYIGKYQMGEYAMIDAGYYKKEGKINNKWDGTFTGKDEVYSKQDFLNNPKAQENALNIYKKIQWQYLKPYHKYVGQTIKGIKITPSGMLAGAHNGGHGGVIEYIKSNGEKDPTDGNGVHVSKYMKKFQDYDVFEWTGMKYSNEEDADNLNNNSEPIKDVNNDIKKKHDEKIKSLNKKTFKDNNKEQYYEQIIEEILRDNTMSRNEKVILLKQLEEKKLFKYGLEGNWKKFLNWLGGFLIIGSTVIPVTAIFRSLFAAAKFSPAAARFIPILSKIFINNLKLNKPLVRQIIINNLKRSAVEGSVSGFVYSVGKSMSEGKTFDEAVDYTVDTVISITVLSALLGTGLSALNLNIGRGKEIIETFTKRKDWGIAFRKASGNPDLALKTILKNQKGFVPNVIEKRGYGNVDFVWGKHDYSTGKGFGFKHIQARRSSQKNIDMNKFWKDFLDTLKYSDAKPDSKRVKDILIEDIKTRIALSKISQGKKRIFPITAYPQKKSVAKRLAAWRPKSKPYVDSRTHFTTELDHNNIITNRSGNFNAKLSSEAQIKFIISAVILGAMIVQSVIDTIWGSKSGSDDTPAPTQGYEFYPFWEYEDETGNPYKTHNIISENGHWVTINGNHVFIKDK